MRLLLRLLLITGLGVSSVLTSQLTVSASPSTSHHIDASMSCSVPCQPNVPRKDEQDSDLIEDQDDTPDTGTDTSFMDFYLDGHRSVILLAKRHSSDLMSTARIPYDDAVRLHLLNGVFRI